MIHSFSSCSRVLGCGSGSEGGALLKLHETLPQVGADPYELSHVVLEIGVD